MYSLLYVFYRRVFQYPCNGSNKSHGFVSCMESMTGMLLSLKGNKNWDRYWYYGVVALRAGIRICI